MLRPHFVSAGSESIRRKSSAAASGTASKLPRARTRASGRGDERIPWWAFSSIRKHVLHVRERVERGAEHVRQRAEGQRILEVAWLLLPEELPSSSCRTRRSSRRARDTASLGDDGVEEASGSPRTPRDRARRRPRGRRAAFRSRDRERGQARRERIVSTSTSASPAASSKSSNVPCTRSAFAERSAWPTDPSIRTRGDAPALSASTSATATSGRARTSSLCQRVDELQHRRRTASAGAEAP